MNGSATGLRPRLLAEVGRLHHKLAYEPRLEVLTRLIASKLGPGDRVLDVGCGSGLLGAALAFAQPGVVVEGVERMKRGGEPIKVWEFDGKKLPFESRSYDVVILADVLHHEADPLSLLKEAARIARRCVIIKDHLRTSAWSYLRICCVDWLGNVAYGVPCRYVYWTRPEWEAMIGEAGLLPGPALVPKQLYHWSLNEIFGRGLHIVYFAEPKDLSAPSLR